MNVIQLFTTAPVDQIVKYYKIFYGEDGLTSDKFSKILIPDFTSKVLINVDWYLSIDHYVTRHDDPVDDEDIISVSIIDNGEKMSMSFIQWGMILNSEVRCNTDYKMSLAEQAAHILYELTWFGDDEDEMQTKSDDLADIVEDLNRSLAAHQEKIENGDAVVGSLPDTLKEFNIDDLFPDETEQEREDRKLKTEARIINWKSAKRYVNGILDESD